MHLLKQSFLLIYLLLFPCLSFALETIRDIEGHITKVSDGDTVHMEDYQGTKVKIRLYGIDAPEIAYGKKPGQPYGLEAKKALQGKLEGREVRAEVYAVDKHKRLVAMIAIGDRDINREMVAEGWAWAYRRYLEGTYASEYVGVEEQARKKHQGLWAQGNPQPPWEFRKNNTPMPLNEGPQ